MTNPNLKGLMEKEGSISLPPGGEKDEEHSSMNHGKSKKGGERNAFRMSR